jgi:hypothetical protein
LGWVDSFSERAEVESASDPAIKVRDRKTDPSSQRTNKPFLTDAEHKWNAAIDQYPQKIEPAGDSIGSLGGVADFWDAAVTANNQLATN